MVCLHVVVWYPMALVLGLVVFIGVMRTYPIPKMTATFASLFLCAARAMLNIMVIAQKRTLYEGGTTIKCSSLENWMAFYSCAMHCYSYYI